MTLTKIRKRDGRLADFNEDKIARAIEKAFNATYKPGQEDVARKLADEVLSLAPVREMDSWLTDLEGGRPHAVRAEQAAAVVRVIETMYESARQGRTIRLD